MPRPLRYGVSLAVLFSSTHAALAAGEHLVKLDRLPPKGSVIEVTSRTEHSGDLGPLLARPNRWGVTGPYRTSAALVIRVTVDEVDPDGWATKVRYEVLRYAVKSGGQTSNLLQGKVFDVRVDGGRRKYLEPTGAAGENFVLDEPKATILDLAVPLRFMKGEAGLDAMFGTGTPRKVGATWQADPAAIAAGFAHLGADARRSRGSATLRKAAAGQSMTVESSAALTGLTYEPPDGHRVVEDKYEVKVTTTLPADPPGLPTAQTVQRAVAVRSVGAGGARKAEWMKDAGQAKYKRVK